MKKKTTVIGASIDMTWDQLDSIEDLNTVTDFMTERQKACLLLAQESGNALMQLLLTDGYTNALNDAEGFRLTQFGQWLDNHFSDTPDDILTKSSYIAAMRNRGIDPFESDEA